MLEAECRVGQKHLKKIGILGGSFDPIHKGHLNIAQSAYEEFALDEVWFIPAGHSPNKDENKMIELIKDTKNKYGYIFDVHI